MLVKKIALWILVVILMYSGVRMMSISAGVTVGHNLVAKESTYMGIFTWLAEPWFENLINLLAFIVLLITLIAIWRQMNMQTKALNSQLVNSQFQQYWKLVEPITKEQVNEVSIYPEDFMDIDTYRKKYKDNTERTHKYVWMMQNYEYLAYCYSAFNRLNIKQTGVDVDVWLNDLITEEEFIDVHNANGKFYPAFSKIIDQRLKELKDK